MTQPESRLSRKILVAIRDEFGTDVYVWKQHGSEYMPAGMPDIVGCLRGMFFAIETKMPGKLSHVSPMQSYTHDKLRAAGCEVLVCSSPQAAVAHLKALLEG